LWEAIHPRRKGKLHGQKRAHYCTKKPATVSQKTVSNTTLYDYARRNTQTVTTEHKRSDFIIAELDKMQIDPKQKAVTDYKEQVDRHTPHPHPIHRKTKKQENQYNHSGHNNQKPNQ